MSINVFFYSDKSVQEVNTIIQESLLMVLDKKSCAIYGALEADDMIKEMASEFGYQARSFFLVDLFESESMNEIVATIKSSFDRPVLALWQNEKII